MISLLNINVGIFINISFILSIISLDISLVYLILLLIKKLLNNKSVKTIISNILLFSKKKLILLIIFSILFINFLLSISELKNNKYNLYFNPYDFGSFKSKLSSKSNSFVIG